jgi:hypothetical protein
MTLELVPVTQAEAKAFVARLHRHTRPPLGSVFQVGVAVDGELVGVAMCGRPVARMLQDSFTLEVNRTCTDGTPNANSMLYGAAARAAKALGYRRLITYTLESEPGTSLKAVGWTQNGETPADQSWARSSRGGGFQPSEHQPDLFGLVKMRPKEAKRRWIKLL